MKNIIPLNIESDSELVERYDYKDKINDNFTGTPFNKISKKKLSSGDTVTNYKHNLGELSTGKLGEYKNSKVIGDFIAAPKVVQDGRVGITKFKNKVNKDLEKDITVRDNNI